MECGHFWTAFQDPASCSAENTPTRSGHFHPVLWHPHGLGGAEPDFSSKVVGLILSAPYQRVSLGKFTGGAGLQSLQLA